MQTLLEALSLARFSHVLKCRSASTAFCETLISVDFAANYLTKIYGLTFGQKPNLRSEVRGGPWA